MTSMQECFYPWSTELQVCCGMPAVAVNPCSCPSNAPELMDFKELLESKSAPHSSADDRNFLCFQGSISSRKEIFP